MNDPVRALIRDTCSYLKQEGHLKGKKTPPPPPKKEAIQKPVVKPPPIPPPMPIPEPSLPPLPKEENTTFFATIQKHLPHLRLIKDVPQMGKVAIVYEREEDHPFLQKLGKAIESRFFPVEIHRSLPHSSYLLVITQKESESIELHKQIVLEPIASYENNTEEKKQLWSTICHRLSQKSS